MASGRLTVLTAALGVVLRAGCTSPAAGEPEPAAPPVVAETPAADDVPTSRVPLQCADLADAVELQSATGAVLPAVDPFGDGTKTLVRFADQQYGALDCAWSTRPIDNDQGVASVEVAVVPDVSSERWAEFTPLMSGDGIERGTFGTDSYLDCATAGTDLSSCHLNSLIGDYWLSVTISAPGIGVTLASATPALTRATDAVTAAAEPAPRWVSPSGASALVGGLDLAAAQAALGASSLEGLQNVLSAQSATRWLPAAELGMTRVVYGVAGLPSGASVDFELDVLPSGAWAFDSGVFAALAQPVEGVGDDALRFESAGDSTVVLTLGDDLVLVTASSGGAPVSPDDTIAIAQAVAGAID